MPGSLYYVANLEELAQLFDSYANNETPLNKTKRAHDISTTRKLAWQTAAYVCRNTTISPVPPLNTECFTGKTETVETKEAVNVQKIAMNTLYGNITKKKE